MNVTTVSTLHFSCIYMRTTLSTEKLGALKILTEKFGRAKQCLALPKVSPNDGEWNLHIHSMNKHYLDKQCKPVTEMC